METKEQVVKKGSGRRAEKAGETKGLFEPI